MKHGPQRSLITTSWLPLPYGRTHRVVMIYGVGHAHQHYNRCSKSPDGLTYRSVRQSEVLQELQSLRAGTGSIRDYPSFRLIIWSREVSSTLFCWPIQGPNGTTHRLFMGYGTRDCFDVQMLLYWPIIDSESIRSQQWTTWWEYSWSVSILANGRSLALYRNVVVLALPKCPKWVKKFDIPYIWSLDDPYVHFSLVRSPNGPSLTRAVFCLTPTICSVSFKYTSYALKIVQEPDISWFLYVELLFLTIDILPSAKQGISVIGSNYVTS